MCIRDRRVASETQADVATRGAASLQQLEALEAAEAAKQLAAERQITAVVEQEAIDRKTFYSRGGRTRAETNAAERERRAGVRADQVDYVKDLEDQYGPQVVKEAKVRRKAEFPDFRPVSYTHLDVYKRQQLFFATRLGSDHSKRYFQSREEVDSCQGPDVYKRQPLG